MGQDFILRIDCSVCPATLQSTMLTPSRNLLLLTLLYFGAHSILGAETVQECPFHKSQTKRGHMKPFGHHARRWLRVESRYDEISAETFYKEYVRPSKPVVIRGGISDWPAVKHWPNMTYLGDRTEDTIMVADWRKIYHEHEFVHAHAVRRGITMRNFIKRMNKENVYMDSPPTAPLMEDMMWPQLTNCPYFISRMRAPSFFFNNGKSNTDIHIDGCETLFFQVSGMRLWLMTPPDNAQYMYSGERYFPPHMGISAVNQHKVNLTLFPKMAESVLHAAVVNPGDLVYVPEAWFHNVMAKGNPNIATTIFFDSSNCEKIYASSNDEDYVVACAKHRRIFLPQSIQCESKLPRGTSWMDVARQFGKENKKLKPAKGMGNETKTIARIRKAKASAFFLKKLPDKSTLPRMVLYADLQSVIDTLPEQTESILQLHYSFFSLQLQDIEPLAQHLLKWKVDRSSVHFMITLPHDVTEQGAEAAGQWLDKAVAYFGAYKVGSLDLVLLEAPPCVPASAKDQDCQRNDAMSKERLSTWRMLEERQKAGQIRHLGVKDVSASELKTLAANAKQRISVVCMRFDPLYRQVALLKAAKTHGAAVMVHSLIGSGWVRDGVLPNNPLFDHQEQLQPIFSETASVHATLYEWALRRGFFVIPERTDKAPVAEIAFDANKNLVSSSWSTTITGIDNMVSEPGRPKRKPPSD